MFVTIVFGFLIGAERQLRSWRTSWKKCPPKIRYGSFFVGLPRAREIFAKHSTQRAPARISLGGGERRQTRKMLDGRVVRCASCVHDLEHEGDMVPPNNGKQPTRKKPRAADAAR